MLLNTVWVFAEPRVYIDNGKTYVLDENDTLWEAGGEYEHKNADYVLVENDVKSFSPTLFFDYEHYILKNDGTFYIDNDKGEKIIIDNNVKKCFYTYYEAWYIKDDNSLWLHTGHKEEGKKQVLEDASELLDMEYRKGFFYKITENNELYICGRMWNEYGYADDMTYTPQKLLDDVKDLYICYGNTYQPYMVYLNTKNELYEIGEYRSLENSDPYEVPKPFESGKKLIADNVTDFYCGYSYLFFTKTDGTLWHRGRNYLNLRQKGDTYIYFDETAVIEDDVKQFHYGYDSLDIIKNNGDLVRYYADYKFTESPDLNESNAMMCMCYGQYGKTTAAQNAVRFIENAAPFASVAYFLDKDNTVWGIGINRYGELGLGEDAPESVIVDTPVECRFLTKFYKTQEEKTDAPEAVKSADNAPPKELYIYLGAVLAYFALLYAGILFRKDH